MNKPLAVEAVFVAAVVVLVVEVVTVETDSMMVTESHLIEYSTNAGWCGVSERTARCPLGYCT